MDSFNRGARQATHDLRLDTAPVLLPPGQRPTAAQGYLAVLRATVPFTPMSQM